MFEAEYIRLVIKPKIDMILEDGVDSIQDLVKKFNKAHDCMVSKSRMTDWLKALEYRMTRKVEVQRPLVRMNRPANPQPAPVREPEMEFNTVHRQQMFNFPAPTSVFSNVPMPGFSE
jgi:hypothetical protein